MPERVVFTFDERSWVVLEDMVGETTKVTVRNPQTGEEKEVDIPVLVKLNFGCSNPEKTMPRPSEETLNQYRKIAEAMAECNPWQGSVHYLRCVFCFQSNHTEDCPYILARSLILKVR